MPPEQDPLDTIAEEVASQAQLVCLDELHVTDVADAMVLARFFEALRHQVGTCLGWVVVNETTAM